MRNGRKTNAQILLLRRAEPDQDRADAGRDRPALRADSGRYAPRRSAQDGFPEDQSERQGAGNRRRRRDRVRFIRDPFYLAEKTGKVLPDKTDKCRGELLSWMFFVASGVGPYS